MAALALITCVHHGCGSLPYDPELHKHRDCRFIQDSVTQFCLWGRSRKRTRRGRTTRRSMWGRRRGQGEGGRGAGGRTRRRRSRSRGRMRGRMRTRRRGEDEVEEKNEEE